MNRTRSQVEGGLPLREVCGVISHGCLFTAPFIDVGVCRNLLLPEGGGKGGLCSRRTTRTMTREGPARTRRGGCAGQGG